MSNEFDLTQPPFDLLTQEEQETLVNSLDLGYFTENETLIKTGKASDFVYVVLKGAAAEIDEKYLQDQDGGVIREYAQEDLFGAISIINETSRYTFKTLEETIAWLIPKAIFEQFLKANKEFAAYFDNSLSQKARLIETYRNKIQGTNEVSTFMMAKVSESVLKTPVVLEAGTSILTATSYMREKDADSLLVKKADEYGMVTRTDLLEAVVLNNLDLETDIAELAKYKLLSVQANDFLFNALVVMTKYKIQRVVVFDGEQLVGLVELTDVISFFSSQSHVIGLQIERSSNLEELAPIAKSTTGLIGGLMSQGVNIRFAMDLLSALNSRIIGKAFEFIIPEEYQDKICMLVMGSEGRGEQILKTDQDNALILADDLHWPELPKYAQKITDTLEDFGYPLCKGNIMVSNPEWVKSLTGWKETLSKWGKSTKGDGLMNLSIFVDSLVVAGNKELYKEVRTHLFENLDNTDMFYSFFAMPIKSFSTPLNFFGGLKASGGGIDIKKGGIFPIVHGVRTLALHHKLKATNTFFRLELLAEQKVLKKKFAKNLAEAMAVLSQLRLEQQLKAATGKADKDEANLINPVELNKLDRDLLREALHLVKEFRSIMIHRYHLDR